MGGERVAAICGCPLFVSPCGLVGEDVNKLVAYIAATSRKLSTPLAIVVQSSSAAGMAPWRGNVANVAARASAPCRAKHMPSP